MADRLAPVCEAIARLLSPHAEVVLHDPATDSVLAIWNPLSKRTVGDPSLLGELDERDVTGALIARRGAHVLASRGLPYVSDTLVLDREGQRPALMLRRHVAGFFQGNRFLLNALINAVRSTTQRMKQPVTNR